MEKRELRKRIKRCGVTNEHLRQGVTSGAYPDIESALERLDSECPIIDQRDHVLSNERMTLINKDIDQALFSLAQATSAWTWLEDYKTVFVLMGPESRGLVLHKKLSMSVQFKLEMQERNVTRFLRFLGDRKKERRIENRVSYQTPLQLYSKVIRTSTTEARIMLESLVRTCDDSGWTHAEFPFVYPGRKLDLPHRLMQKHRLMVHNPHTIQPFM